LLVLTVLVALVVGWWLDHRQLAAANEQLNQNISSSVAINVSGATRDFIGLIAGNQNLSCSYAVSSPIRGRALKALQVAYAGVPGVRFLGPRPLQGYPTTDCYLISAPNAVLRAIDGALDAIDEIANAYQLPTTP